MKVKETIARIMLIIAMIVCLIWGVYAMLHDDKFWESVQVIKSLWVF